VAGPSEQLDVRILGPLEVVSNGSAVSLGGRKQRAVLAMLATRVGAAVSADELIESLWPEHPPATATTTVQVYVSRLRKALGADRIETSGGGYVLRVAPEQLDAARFRRLAADGRSAEALALWRGPALADFVYESWAQGEAARLEEERLACVEQRIDADLEAGRHAELVGELEALVAEHPLRERLRGQLMLALYRAGRQADALEVYQRARATLVDELGIEPSPELQELNRKILQQDVEPATRAPRRELPRGTVTLLATDIEGSTRLLADLGPEAYADSLVAHRRIMRDSITSRGGVEVDTQGDAFLIAFARASDAVAAAGDAQRALAEGPIRVRMGLHSGEPLLTEEGYVGMDVHQATRVMSAGHGGQVLLSHATRALLDDTVALRELGRHRLKDMTAPQPLYQLGEGDFPPLNTLQQSNLPIQPTPLVGREVELGEISRLLSEARLVTLTGAGGSGKTRLALQAAADIAEDFDHGVWWVSLAALRDPQLVESTIAQAVGAKGALGEHLRQWSALVLIDNFEHLLDAAGVVSDLLPQAPDVVVLATSRARLGLAAEQEYAVPPMTDSEAVALFTARARRLRPQFEPDHEVFEICHRLDGQPLAIELAAARVKVLRPAQILDRLSHRLDLLTSGARDAPERQQTLRATIEWSHALLDDAERGQFARLAVFAGSFDLEAAEAVCDADVDTLAGLVDKSMLRQTEESRFFMLEAIHEFAFGRLEDSGEAEAMRDRHADYFRSLAEVAEPELKGSEQSEWGARLDSDQANLRLALEWSVRRDKETALRLCASLERFWAERGYRIEGSRWLEAALRDSEDVSTPIRARALHAAASIAVFLGERERGQELLEQSLTLFRELDSADGVAVCLVELGAVACMQRDFNRAFDRLEEAFQLYRELDDQHGIARALHLLGDARRDAGDAERARPLLEESLEVSRRAGDLLLSSATMHSLGDVALDDRDAGPATAHYSEGLAIVHSLGMKPFVNVCLGGLAAAAALAGHRRRAAQLWGAVETLEDELGARLLEHERSRYEPLVLEACQRHPDALAEGRAMALDRAVEYALSTLDA
jgi:predicted ATPase/DNA-binding SARP family transcriptional activator